MNIFVASSSRETSNKMYINAATEIGRFIVEGKHNYIFGGCNSGLMKVTYLEVLKSHESEIIVSMAKAYKDELKNVVYNEVFLYDTVVERKNGFISLSDVLVFLPGGIGTLDELFTSIESKRSGDHNLPIIIVNENNYFAPLLEMLDKIYKEKFADEKNKELYFIADNSKIAVEKLKMLAKQN